MNTAFGLTMGFSTIIQPELLTAVKNFGWTHIRNGHATDNGLNLAIAQQIYGAGLTPVLGELQASALVTLPLTDVMVEARGSFAGAANVEPIFSATDTVDDERAALNAVVPAIKAKRLKVYVGMAGTKQSDLAYLTTLLRGLDPVFGVSVHRYPPTLAETWEAPQWKNRDYEMQQLKAVIGKRPFIVGEFGWNQGAFRSLHNYFPPFGHDHLTDQEQYDAIKGEFAYWQAAGADVACLYQFTDGPIYCPKHTEFALAGINGYGIRRVNSDGSHKSWKPVASLPVDSVKKIP